MAKEYVDLSSGQSISTADLIRALRLYLRPYRGRFVLSTFCRMLGETAFTSNPFVYAVFITLLANHGDLSKIYFYFALWGAGSLMRVIGQRSGRLLSNRFSEHVAIDVELAGMDTLVAYPLIAHEAEDTGNKIKRIQKGGEGFKQIIRLWQDQWIAVFTHIVSMLLIILIIDWKIGVLLGLFIISYFLISRPQLIRAGKLARRVNKQEEAVSGFIFEIINNVRTTKVMQLFPWLRVRLHAMSNELYNRIERRTAAFQGAGFINGIYGHIIRLFFVGYIIYGVHHGSYQIGFILMFIMYFTNVRDSTEIFSESLEEFAVARHHVARFVDISKHVPKNNSEGAKPFPKDWKELAVTNLSFGYGENAVLKSFNLKIKRGERVGIVGASGAGKSTLFKLLLKEHRDFTGTINLGNTAISDINPKSFADAAAVVLQDTEVFNLSLRENIVLGIAENEQTEDRLARALEVSHVSDFLNKMPLGVETLIGEKGIKLSGGERQRVGIARAVYKEPQILFLDEATSHLDVESEEKIQDSLHQFFQEVTAIVIAHRLTTLKEMDRILVMENGAIIEEGSFEKLYKAKGRFYDLWEKQKL